MLRASEAATERVVTPGVLQEMAQAGVVTKLCVMLRADQCGVRKDQGAGARGSQAARPRLEGLAQLVPKVFGALPFVTIELTIMLSLTRVLSFRFILLLARPGEKTIFEPCIFCLVTQLV